MEESPRLAVDNDVASVVSRALKLEDFFPEFEAEHLQKLFPRSGLYRYAPESAVIKQGEPGRDLFVVYSGAVRIQQSFGTAAASLDTLGPGALIGEIALLKDGLRTASVVASGEARLFRLVFDDLQYILKNNDALAEHLRALAEKRLK